MELEQACQYSPTFNDGENVRIMGFEGSNPVVIPVTLHQLEGEGPNLF